jgi:hypothetical protein
MEPAAYSVEAGDIRRLLYDMIGMKMGGQWIKIKKI